MQTAAYEAHATFFCRFGVYCRALRKYVSCLEWKLQRFDNTYALTMVLRALKGTNKEKSSRKGPQPCEVKEAPKPKSHRASEDPVDHSVLKARTPGCGLLSPRKELQ